MASIRPVEGFRAASPGGSPTSAAQQNNTPAEALAVPARTLVAAPRRASPPAAGTAAGRFASTGGAPADEAPAAGPGLPQPPTPDPLPICRAGNKKLQESYETLLRYAHLIVAGEPDVRQRSLDQLAKFTGPIDEIVRTCMESTPRDLDAAALMMVRVRIPLMMHQGNAAAKTAKAAEAAKVVEAAETAAMLKLQELLDLAGQHGDGTPAVIARSAQVAQAVIAQAKADASAPGSEAAVEHTKQALRLYTEVLSQPKGGLPAPFVSDLYRAAIGAAERAGDKRTARGLYAEAEEFNVRHEALVAFVQCGRQLARAKAWPVDDFEAAFGRSAEEVSSIIKRLSATGEHDWELMLAGHFAPAFYATKEHTAAGLAFMERRLRHVERASDFNAKMDALVGFARMSRTLGEPARAFELLQQAEKLEQDHRGLEKASRMKAWSAALLFEAGQTERAGLALGEALCGSPRPPVQCAVLAVCALHAHAQEKWADAVAFGTRAERLRAEHRLPPSPHDPTDDLASRIEEARSKLGTDPVVHESATSESGANELLQELPDKAIRQYANTEALHPKALDLAVSWIDSGRSEKKRSQRLIKDIEPLVADAKPPARGRARLAFGQFLHRHSMRGAVDQTRRALRDLSATEDEHLWKSAVDAAMALEGNKLFPRLSALLDTLNAQRGKARGAGARTAAPP